MGATHATSYRDIELLPKTFKKAERGKDNLLQDIMLEKIRKQAWIITISIIQTKNRI